MVVGFGLSSRSNEYKVLGIINYPGPSGIDVVRSEVYVYTLGDESWRLKENTPDLNLGQSASKAFVNGALHWVILLWECSMRACHS
ncbi:hypothetical protein F0562_011222 [Nyssa sinensis]|uniref:F-box associated beta-propeller type 1 domain-containing protein n=1 Tax=Nyssa sinensis TaxID=561372 RepID=A0A5J5A3D0_9ASTE|nr:hypothetical protein F0562_011222 [Nyssa sinensis]